MSELEPEIVTDEVTPDPEAAAPPDAAEQSGATQSASWAPDPNEWQQMMGTVAQLAQLMQPQPEEPAAPDLSGLIGYDDEGNLTINQDQLFGLVDQRAQALVDQRLGDVTPILDDTIRERGDRIVEERFVKLESEVGKFDHEIAAVVAQGLLSDTQEPFAAIQQGAQRVAAYEARIRAEAVEEFRQTLGAVGDAPNQHAANGAAVDYVKPRPGMAGYDDVTASFLERHGVAS